MRGGVYAVLACAFGLVYRILGVFHVAMAGIFPVAPFVAWWLGTRFGLPAVAAIPVGVFVGALGGLLLEWGVYGPFNRRNASNGPTVMASFGVWTVLVSSLSLLFGTEVRVLDRRLVGGFRAGAVALTSVQLASVAVCVLTLAGFAFAIRRLRPWIAVWAMGEEPDLARTLGLPVARYRAAVMALSAALCSLAASLIAFDVGVQPSSGMSHFMVAMVAVLVGGLDSLLGWVVSGYLLAILQAFLSWRVSSSWLDAGTFALLVVVLLFRPQGIFGLRRRLEEV